jgi:catechol 2,3-dioxygenase-like lactoylglutathione lyase family enzyme
MDPLDRSHTAPKFAAADPQANAAWYVDFLGFPHISIYQDGQYAIVRRGNFTLHFWKCAERHIAENTACYVELLSIAALEALHTEVLDSSKRQGFAPGRVDAAPKDKLAQGMREFHLWDPAGNLISFGASLPERI